MILGDTGDTFRLGQGGGMNVPGGDDVRSLHWRTEMHAVVVLVFECEDQTRAAADMIRNAPPPATVTFESVEVREVVANA